MGRHTLNEAEQGFLGALLSDEQTKTAVELDPGTAEALGLPAVSPSILAQLESQAADVDSDSPGPTEQAPPPEEEDRAPDVDGAAGLEEAAEVEDRVDQEPELDPEALPTPELPSRLTHGRLFSDKEAHPLQMFDVLNLRYKTDWVDWEPETLWWAIRRDFGPVGDLARNKIGALRAAATTDVPWLDWDVFENAGLAWNGLIPMVGAYQPMTPAQTAFTVQLLRELRADEPYETEVKAYIAAILEDYGFVYAPPEFFDGAHELLERKAWLAGLRSDVQDAWERVREMDPSTISWRDDNPVDVHVVRLFIVQNYLAEQEANRQSIPGAPANASTTSPPVPS
jgi:hypothetical protein